jgi:hypothetical protein
LGFFTIFFLLSKKSGEYFEKIIKKNIQMITNKEKGKRRLGKNHASINRSDQVELKKT